MATYIPPISVGFGSGGGGTYIPPIDLNFSTPTAPPEKKVDTSFGGYGRGLLHGIEQTVTSIPSIVIRGATDPGGLISDTVSSTYDLARHTAAVPRAFANLAVGDMADFHKFYSQYRDYFYTDPFANTLFVLGGGKALGGRLGALNAAREAGQLGDAAALSRAALLGRNTGPFVSGGTRTIQVQLGKDIPGVGQIGDSIPTRLLGPSHFNANRAYAVDKLLKQLPQDFPLVGEAHRAARATRKEGRVDYLRYLSSPQYIERQKAYKALTRDEKAAAGLLNKTPIGVDADTWAENLKMLGTPEADALVRQMTNPKIREIYDNWQNYPRVVRAHEAGAALAPLRTEIMLKTGALTQAEADAAPWRITRQLRGARLATPAWVYKQTRKVNASLRQIAGAKGKLVTAAKAFGTRDVAEQIKLGREASNAAIKESGYRAKLFEEVSKPVKLPTSITTTAPTALLDKFKVYDVPAGTHVALQNDIAANGIKTPIEVSFDPEGRAIITDGNHRLAIAQRLGLKEVPIKVRRVKALPKKKVPMSDHEKKVFGIDQIEPPIPRGQQVNFAPDKPRDVTDLAKETDAAYAEKQKYAEDLGMVTSGQMTTELLDKAGLTPKGGWGQTKTAVAQAVHNVVRNGHVKELKGLQKMLKLARERRLPTKALDAMGLKIPSDIRLPTPAELEQATKDRAYRDTLVENLKRRGKSMTPEERARVTKVIQDLTEKINKLENPRHIRRSPSYSKRRFESRYAQAEKKLQKQIAAKQKIIEDMGKEVPIHKDPAEATRITLMGWLEREHRRATIRYTRAVQAEHEHAASIERHLDARIEQAKSEQEIGRLREVKMKFIQAQRVRLHDLNQAYEDQVALRNEIQGSTGQLVGGGSPWELAAEARAAGRPIPYYSPDEMLTGREAKRLGAAEGSILPQRPGGDIYKSRSILMRTGLLALHPDTLSPAYFRAAKHDLNVTMHGIAMRLATRISKDEPLPKGYEYLRRTPGETISETAKHKGEHLRALEDQYGREQDLSTPDPADGEIDFSNADGSTYRLIIPKAYANEFRAESLRAQTTVGKIFKQGMDVWRSLVLHLRVPWLVNNVIGNTFMFAMRFAGLNGLTNFARMMASNPLTRKYIPSMERLALQHLTKDQVREIFPEQVRGTHFETQAPGEIPLPGKLARLSDPLETTRLGLKAHQAVAGIPRLLPRADKATERRLRAAATNEVLRGSPQVKAIYKEMKRQGSGTFHDAVTKAIENDPHFRDYVVQEVNDALGNFLSLSRAERSALRRVVPFYAWMREITRVAGRMLVDHPGRVLLLSQLAKVTAEMRAEDVPSYLQGTVLGEKTGWLQRLLGGDHAGLQTALNVRSMSPYATLADMAYGGAALLPGSSKYNVSDFAGNFSPAIAGLYSVAAGRGGQGNLLANYAQQLWGSVPQTQILTPYPSPIYPDRGRLDLLAKLGLANPVVHYDPNEASYQNFLGR